MSKLDKTTLTNELTRDIEKARRYSLVAFIVLICLIYGVVLFRFQTLRNAEPTPEAVSSHIKSARVPHIDEDIVKQLESLEDNSVNVQALFNQARRNPFQ
jgi:hypothetical protein